MGHFASEFLKMSVRWSKAFFFQPVSQPDHHLVAVHSGADFLSQTRWLEEKPQISAHSKLLGPFLNFSGLTSWTSVTLFDMYYPRNNAASS